MSYPRSHAFKNEVSATNVIVRTRLDFAKHVSSLLSAICYLLSALKIAANTSLHIQAGRQLLARHPRLQDQPCLIFLLTINWKLPILPEYVSLTGAPAGAPGSISVVARASDGCRGGQAGPAHPPAPGGRGRGAGGVRHQLERAREGSEDRGVDLTSFTTKKTVSAGQRAPPQLHFRAGWTNILAGGANLPN